MTNFRPILAGSLLALCVASTAILCRTHREGDEQAGEVMGGRGSSDVRKLRGVRHTPPVLMSRHSTTGAEADRDRPRMVHVELVGFDERFEQPARVFVTAMGDTEEIRQLCDEVRLGSREFDVSEIVRGFQAHTLEVYAYHPLYIVESVDVDVPKKDQIQQVRLEFVLDKAALARYRDAPRTRTVRLRVENQDGVLVTGGDTGVFNVVGEHQLGTCLKARYLRERSVRFEIPVDVRCALVAVMPGYLPEMRVLEKTIQDNAEVVLVVRRGEAITGRVSVVGLESVQGFVWADRRLEEGTLIQLGLMQMRQDENVLYPVGLSTVSPIEEDGAFCIRGLPRGAYQVSVKKIIDADVDEALLKENVLDVVVPQQGVDFEFRATR